MDNNNEKPAVSNPLELLVMLRNELSENYCSPNVGDNALNNPGRVHDWRNYVPECIENIWGELTERERMLIAIVAESPADQEEWA